MGVGAHPRQRTTPVERPEATPLERRNGCPLGHPPPHPMPPPSEAAPSCRWPPPSSSLGARMISCHTAGPGTEFGTASAGIAANGHARPHLPPVSWRIFVGCGLFPNTRSVAVLSVVSCVQLGATTPYRPAWRAFAPSTYVHALPSAVKGSCTPPHCSFSPHEVCPFDLCRFSRRRSAVLFASRYAARWLPKNALTRNHAPDVKWCSPASSTSLGWDSAADRASQCPIHRS
jgi:hypothetical protein